MASNESIPIQPLHTSSLDDFFSNYPFFQRSKAAPYYQSVVDFFRDYNGDDNYIYVIVSHSYLELAKILSANSRKDLSVIAENALDSALEYAEKSRDNDTFHSVLYQGGMCLEDIYLRYDKFEVWEKTVLWLQRSLRYIDRRRSLQTIIETYERLGRVWSHNPDTYVNTYLMFDWLIQLQDTPYRYMINKYKVMLLLGQEEEVWRKSDMTPKDSCHDIAMSTSACIALNRIRRAANLARKGIALAVSVGDPQWETAFQDLIAARQHLSYIPIS